jgi:hypothetical protein
MREEFTVALRSVNPSTNEVKWVPVKQGLSFQIFRHAADYLDEFYSGPDYFVISRHVTDWMVVS